MRRRTTASPDQLTLSELEPAAAAGGIRENHTDKRLLLFTPCPGVNNTFYLNIYFQGTASPCTDVEAVGTTGESTEERRPLTS